MYQLSADQVLRLASLYRYRVLYNDPKIHIGICGASTYRHHAYRGHNGGMLKGTVNQITDEITRALIDYPHGLHIGW